MRTLSDLLNVLTQHRKSDIDVNWSPETITEVLRELNLVKSLIDGTNDDPDLTDEQSRINRFMTKLFQHRAQWKEPRAVEIIQESLNYCEINCQISSFKPN